MGAIIMALLVLITFANVVVRYLTNRSFAWTEEFSVFLLVVLTLAGSAYAALHDSHIRIDFIYAGGTKKRRSMLRLYSRIMTSAMFLMIAVLSARSAIGEYALGETTTGVGLPRWLYTVWFPPLALWTAVRVWMNPAERGSATEDQAQDLP
ncbi:TRAP transporter small permease subunit [Bradyrhizobium sp. 200]|uniref:TRAP transporter small permease n=1 Tax=Bradyrhizobium sp. 200 TaxID=2782665 RepID=UPI001FFF1992|nr:TRAP transporter small permease [Bradyrhizobium sp. 200]UPJ48418.1 TRAP transporter small permease subunit [Bradyrhizobium sp. 200]